MEADGEDLAEAPSAPVGEPSPKKRGRPKGVAKAKSSSKPENETEKPTTPAQAKLKAQCMGCGKVFDRKLMASNRYCVDDKMIIDRLYHAAKAQGCTEWLADQLSTLEGSQRIVAAYKLRFPNWKTKKTPIKGFMAQYREMIVAETSVLYDNDGIMMTEDRFVQEMAKPERGGLTSSAARLKFADLLQDPTAIKDKILPLCLASCSPFSFLVFCFDRLVGAPPNLAANPRKGGEDRARVELDDHVHLQNKYSRLKQLLTTEQAKKNATEEDLKRMRHRVLSEHDKQFAADDVEMLSMAQQMARGAGRSAAAFEGQMMQLGELKDLIPDEKELQASGLTEAAPSKKDQSCFVRRLL